MERRGRQGRRLEEEAIREGTPSLPPVLVPAASAVVPGGVAMLCLGVACLERTVIPTRVGNADDNASSAN